MAQININERSALVFHIVENCKDWEKIYLIAKGPKSLDKVTEDSKNTLIYRWKNKPYIKEALKDIAEEYDRKKKIFIDEILAGGETEPRKGATKKENAEKTNFLDRDEFLKFLNQRANQITDDKLRNDILKMLSDNLRYKDSDNNETQEIQRFYTPKTCESCEIYNKCKSCKWSECPESGK